MEIGGRWMQGEALHKTIIRHHQQRGPGVCLHSRAVPSALIGYINFLDPSPKGVQQNTLVGSPFDIMNNSR